MPNTLQAPPNLHPEILQAYRVLAGESLSREQALRLMNLNGPDVLDLVSLAHKVRTAFAPQDHICTIMNAKCGACAEDCRFCAQSAHHQADLETYPWAGTDAVLAQAETAYAKGVRRFGIVTSGTGYPRVTPEFASILDAIRRLRERLPGMSVCGSLGLLSEETARALAEAGVSCYNLNLQVAPSRYADLIATTHAASDRQQTIALLRAAGIRVCSGGILGLGESPADRVDLAFALAALDAEVVPLNVLLPIPGTPLQDQPPLSALEIAKTVAVFRLILPAGIIKLAAGRETRMKDFQGLLLLAGANGFLTGGYLTTRGRDTSEDDRLRAELEAFRVS